ncbi:hypothetical protein AAFF_G00188790 [Aldrovandia affinis]|uniref:Uncharacterized protein n=1 Tax=Aldrovandia affinis TaxID=143900 RepID=A0AAD7WVM7_9TELE|nr:hypothetical protein AAFF_G00188790 [Aldrovandia affinis]
MQGVRQSPIPEGLQGSQLKTLLGTAHLFSPPIAALQRQVPAGRGPGVTPEKGPVLPKLAERIGPWGSRVASTLFGDPSAPESVLPCTTLIRLCAGLDGEERALSFLGNMSTSLACFLLKQLCCGHSAGSHARDKGH